MFTRLGEEWIVLMALNRKSKTMSILLTMAILLILWPGVAYGAAAVGTASGTAGYSYIWVDLSSGTFSADVTNISNWTLNTDGGQTITTITKSSDTSVRLDLSSNIAAGNTITVQAGADAFAVGTEPFTAPLEVSIIVPTPAQGTATAIAGTQNITVKLTYGSFGASLSAGQWILGGASAGENPITSVTKVSSTEATITLTKAISVSDTYTITAQQSAFVNIAVAPFATPLPVTISTVGDTTPPEFLAGYPKEGDTSYPPGSKTIEVVFKANESGNSYYVILPTSASTPDGQKILEYHDTKTGIDGVLCDGFYGYNHESVEEHKIVVSSDSFADNTSYKFCIVLEDDQHNVGIATAVTVTTPLPLPAITVTASASNSTPVAGADNEITLTVKNSAGDTDTTFTGVHQVTVSGVQATPSGLSCGSFYSYSIPGTGTLTTGVIFTEGVAKPSLSLFKAGPQTINFSVAGVLNPSASLNLTVVPRSPAVMMLTQDITAPAANGGQFAQQPILRLTDSYANLCTNDSTTQVTASKEDAGSWTLTGTTTVTAVNGIVTFTDLGATNAAQVTGARIRFTSTAATNDYLSAQVTLPAPDSVMVANALYAAENAAYSNMTQAAASSEDAIKAALRNTAVSAVNNSNIVVTINKVSYTPPVAGTSANTSGTNGSYTFTVTVSKGAQSQTTTQKTITITATTYSTSGSSGGGGGGGSTPAGILVTTNGTDVSNTGVSLSFPAGAVESDIRVQVSEASLTAGMDLPADSQLISKVVDIIKNKSGNFSKPVTITMSFNKSQIDPDKYDIKLCYFDEENGEWVELDNIKVDLANGTVSGQVTHFTKFAVIATLKASEKGKTPQIQALQSEPGLPADLAGHWAKGSITELINAGVISGYPDGSFQPDKTVTRAEFTVMLVKALKLESRAGSQFTDTAAHWAGESISTAAAHGLISGYTQSTFGPDDLITREQAAVIIARAAQLEAGEQTLAFNDAQQVAPWALPGVAAVVSKSYMSGYPDNSFRPQGNTTRAEAAAIISKLL